MLRTRWSSMLMLAGCVLLLVHLVAAVHSGMFSNSLGTELLTARQTADSKPCDTAVNQCMDWCGETVRRPGYCPNNQMCCLLIY